RLHVGDCQEPVGELVRARVRFREAEVHQLIGGPQQQEIGQRELQVAGNETELVRLRVEVQVVVVSQGEKAFQVRHQGVGRHKPQKDIDVEKRVDLCLELSVGRLVHEPGKGNHPL